jgi:hypothetical protein
MRRDRSSGGAQKVQSVDIPGIKKDCVIPVRTRHTIKAAKCKRAATGERSVNSEAPNMPIKIILLEPNLLAKMPAKIWRLSKKDLFEILINESSLRFEF